MIPVLDFVGAEGRGTADRWGLRLALAGAGLPVPDSEVVRSAWGAALFAERAGGWPLVLKSAIRGDGRGIHHVGDARHAALLLENGDREPWLAERRIAVDAVATVVVDPSHRGPGATLASIEPPRWAGAGTVPGERELVVAEAAEVARRAAAVVAPGGPLAVELFLRRNRAVVNDAWSLDGADRRSVAS